MKILIIEDEPLVARDLIKLVNKLRPQAEMLGPLNSVSVARAWFKENALPDLILADIQLSDGISFEIFEGFPEHRPIIFTTAYDAYAIRAFKLNSIDYLLKPIDESELSAALTKYEQITRYIPLEEQLKSLLYNWGGELKKYKERFLSLQRNSLVPVVTEEIAFFHKEELIFIQTVKGEKLISEHATLDEIESLVDPDKFFRINRQYLIHLQTVFRIKSTHKGLTISLKAPYTLDLDISREKAAAFKKWIG